MLHLLEGARNAKGLTVIIDVFRAFSLACYMAHNGADKIIPIASIDDAYRLKEQNPDYILVGERNERIPVGFDFGNSPTHILDHDFTGKIILHTTSAGTQGLVNAIQATERITGSFVNAPAIVSYIKSRNPVNVSLVCMGYSMLYSTEEDTLCAEYIKSCLENEDGRFDEKKDLIRKTSAQRLFDPANQEFSPSSDFDLCMDLGRFDFILKVQENGEGMFLKKEFAD